MQDVMQAVNDRTQLAGTNRLEVLMFRLQSVENTQADELFGVNVFKVRELMKVPKLTPIPGMPECVVGVAKIRGSVLPVIDLKHYCGINSPCKPKILIVTEFNSSTQGFLVHDVDDLAELDWNEVRPPPDISQSHNAGTVSSIGQLKDGRMLMILDVEKMLADVLQITMPEIDNAQMPTDLDGRLVYFVDDSEVARRQMAITLDTMGVPHQSASNGQEALDTLTAMATAAAGDGVALATRIQAIVTDVEMPIKDGYVFTREIKADRRFDGIPVMMHSSLSASENVRLGMEVGADGYIPKLHPQEFAEELGNLIKGAQSQAVRRD